VMKPAVMPNHWKGIVKSQLSMPRPVKDRETTCWARTTPKMC
jgi:hypothetical protein